MRKKRSFLIGIFLIFIAGLCMSACNNGNSTMVTQAFVKASEGHLFLNDKLFRFGGTNIYWLGLDENVGHIAYPSKFRIKDALITAKDMGATVIRSHTLGISVGNPLSLEPSLNTFNYKAFQSIDYSIYEARLLGLRLIIPLTDNWHYYEGGLSTFTNWLGVSPSDFYTNVNVIAAFKKYIKVLLTHLNPYTGKRLDNDPTIMAWELGNELNQMSLTWVNEIGSYIHYLAGDQLIAAGSQFGVAAAALKSPFVNIIDCHFYFPFETPSQIKSLAQNATVSHKVFIAGEYGSTTSNDAFYAELALNKNVSGALFWSLFAHLDTYGYEQHADGFTVHFPGVSLSMHTLAQSLRDLNLAMGAGSQAMALNYLKGQKLPTLPAPTTPEITRLELDSAGIVIAWRGSSDALNYSIQASSNASYWTTICNKCATDDSTPVTLNSIAPRFTYFRVIAYNQSAIPSMPSAVVRLSKS
jgi:mannan endo-1,4-beta-mannosidase